MEKKKNEKEWKTASPKNNRAMAKNEIAKHTASNSLVIRQGSGVRVSKTPTNAEQLKLLRKPSPATVAAREKLAKAGILATDLGIPEDIAPVSDEELERRGEMRPGARSSEDLLNEERGTY